MPIDEEELLEVMISDQMSQPYGNPVLIDGNLNNRKIVAQETFKPSNFRRVDEKQIDTPKPDFRMRSNLNEEEIDTMKTRAEMIQYVYSTTKKAGIQTPFNENEDRKNYVLTDEKFKNFDIYDSGSSLSHLFVDEQNKNVIIAMRGLLPSHDNRDRKMLIEMSNAMLQIPFISETRKRGEISNFGKRYEQDVQYLVNTVNYVENEFPNYTIELTGDSRAGAATLDVGREYNLKTYAFNPAGHRRESQREFEGYDPQNINIFTSDIDLIPKFIRDNVKYSPENNYIVTNKNPKGMFGTPIAKGHSINHFTDEENIHMIRKKSKIILDKDKFNKMREIKGSPAPYTPPSNNEGGRGDIPPQKLISFEEKLMLGRPETTKRLVSSYDDFGLFNDDEITVFSILNKQPERIFRPYRNTFDLIDRNNDNKISYNEYKSYYLNKGLSEKSIRIMFNKLDTNNDGFISSVEWRL